MLGKENKKKPAANINHNRKNEAEQVFQFFTVLRKCEEFSFVMMILWWLDGCSVIFSKTSAKVSMAGTDVPVYVCVFVLGNTQGSCARVGHGKPHRHLRLYLS